MQRERNIPAKKGKKLVFRALVWLCCLAACAGMLLVLCRSAIEAGPYALFYQEGLADVADYDYILVPGAGVTPFGPGSQLKDRLDTARILYAQRPAATVVISGAYDAGVDLHEADVMREYLVACGVPASAIVEDRYGQSTYDTLWRAKDYIKESAVVICTQELYVPRSMYIAGRLGLNAVAASSDIRIYTEGEGRARLREFFAQTKAVLQCSFFPGSAYALTEYPFVERREAGE